MRTGSRSDAAPEFYVIFPSREKRVSWVDFLTDPVFRHVSVAKVDPKRGDWTFLDAGPDGVIIENFRLGPVDDDLARELFSEEAILRVSPGKGPVFGSRWLPSCVTAVKHVIGSPSRALRPAALWRDLVKNGAIIVREPRAAENPTVHPVGRPRTRPPPRT